MKRSPHGIVTNMLDCDIIVSEFKLQPYSYIHFQTYALEKGMNYLIPSAKGWIVTLLFFKEGFDIK